MLVNSLLQKLHARRFGHWCCLSQDTMKGEIPERFDVSQSTMSQQHGYKLARMEWGRNKHIIKQ